MTHATRKLHSSPTRRSSDLLSQIEQLKSQLKPEKPVTPAACRMTGRVDGDVLHLKAEYDFVTGQDRASDEVELRLQDRKSTRLNSSHLGISYAVFCLKKKKT